jgi:hypothetical protein
MKLNIYDLPHLQRSLIQTMIDETMKQFPDMKTSFDIWLNPDDKEHILVNVAVPFFDNERETEFSSFTAELSCEIHEQSGVLISLMPHYVPALNGTHSYEPA